MKKGTKKPKVKQRKPRNPAGRIGEPITLNPLSFEQAVSNLLKVKPAKHETKKVM